jgi:hypothetical protein
MLPRLTLRLRALSGVFMFDDDFDDDSSVELRKSPPRN